MKRLIMLCLTLLVAAALTACGGAPTGPGNASPAVSPETGAPLPSGAGTDRTLTVTVSTIEELAAAIGNDTRIILKAGTYNFSELDGEAVDNPFLTSYRVGSTGDFRYYYTFSGVSNLALEAEEGAQVNVVTESGGAVVLEFAYCSGISLKGLTCGHDVEPGNCSGSVINALHSRGVSIDGCRLYGSGTYGVSAYGAEEITVTDTDIYECTYGIIELVESNTVAFKNCRFYENDGENMFDLYNSWDILFEDTEIYDNRTGGRYYNYAINDELSSEIVFRRCVFKNNYNDPSPADYPYITFEDCDLSLSSAEPELSYAYARLAEVPEDDSYVYLELSPVVWVNWDDEALMEHYGITYDDMPNDYYIVDESVVVLPCVGFKSDNTSYYILKPDPEYGFPASTLVGSAEFIDAIKAADGELLVTYTPSEWDPNALAEISQTYVP